MEAKSINNSWILRCGHVIDGKSDLVAEDRYILIKNERIIEIGGKEIADSHQDISVTDLSEYWILPGLIDAHCHPLIMADDYQFKHLKYSSAYKGLYGLKVVQEMLMCGWTSIRICGDADVHYAHLDIKRAIDNGLFVGPRITGAGHYLSITGGGGDINNLAPEHCCVADGKIVDGVDAMRKAVREEVKYGSEWIKILVTGAFATANDDPRNVHYSPEELQVCVDEATRLGRPVCAHAHAAEGIKQAIIAGVRSVEHATFIDEEGIKLALERGTFIVPTIYVGKHFVDEGSQSGSLNKLIELHKRYEDLHMSCLKNAYKAGVKIVVGTDYLGWKPISRNVRELQCLIKHAELPPMYTIKAATSVASECLQWDDKLGSIEIGKLADIIAVKKNPLDDISILEDVKFVMIGGKLVKWDKL